MSKQEWIDARKALRDTSPVRLPPAPAALRNTLSRETGGLAASPGLEACGMSAGAAGTAATIGRMAKRGYSREFTPRSDRRIKIEIDRVPPTLAEALRAKVKRDGLSIRSVTLTLWKQWIEGDTDRAK